MNGTAYELDLGGGESVTVAHETLVAIDAVVRTLPGAKAVWWRRPGERWRPIGEQRGQKP